MSGFGGAEVRRYSAFDPAEVHRDMEANPAATARALAKSPAVAEAHKNCSTCAELTKALAPETSRRARIVVTLTHLTNALRLPPGTRVTRIFVTDDPQLLNVVIEGEHLDEVPLTAETPRLRP